VIYSEETSGREFVDQAIVSLSTGAVVRAVRSGQQLTTSEVLILARSR
jgi:hypothetical protein